MLNRLLRRTTVLITAGLLAGAGLAGPATARPHAMPAASEHATGWYLALGDSLAAGYQPGAGDDKDGGYVGQVLDAVQDDHPKTKLRNLACSGETTVTLVDGGRCTYPQGSQLDQATQFLKAHARTARLVTLTIGANDVQRCVSRSASGISVNQPCIAAGMGDVAALLPQALTDLRQAAPDAEIIVTNYYNPFLAAWLTGPAGEDLAKSTVALQATLNTIIAAAAAAAGAATADLAAAFASDDFTPVSAQPIGFPGELPRSVLNICAWTWMCSKTDIHANDAGYAVIAGAVAAKLS
ncbi:MAG TPA: SGNH/GDSL hydrolase family protein [Nocardioidaceae bacterium]|nr:SGNH/GDSL hydrolase family protein [Nocardioidaceae bacterium]